MFEKLKLLVAKFLLKKYALGYLVQVYVFLRGYKTQISIALAVVVYAAEIFGYVDHDTAEKLYALLGGAGGISFMAKLKQWEGALKEGADMVKAEADKSAVASPPPAA